MSGNSVPQSFIIMQLFDFLIVRGRCRKDGNAFILPIIYLNYISADVIGPSFITSWTHISYKILDVLYTMEASLLRILCPSTDVLVTFMCSILISSFQSPLKVHNANLSD